MNQILKFRLNFHPLNGYNLMCVSNLHSYLYVVCLCLTVCHLSCGVLSVVFKRLIHHSDRGVQYCSAAYTDELKKYGVRISMTEDYKPTDNAIAERVNGTLKTEVVYRERRFKSISDARERIASFIAFYNDSRPHASIGMKPPSQAHREHGLQQRVW